MPMSKSKFSSLSLIVFLIVFILNASGQEKPSFVAIRSGISIPFGKYYEKTLEAGSFALPGINITTEGAWFINSKWGIGAAIGYNLNPVDVGNLGYEKVIADPFLEDVYIRSDPFTVITTMGGVYVQLPVKPKLSFTAKGLIGVLYVKTPHQLYQPEYFLVGPSYFEITSAKDMKFSWQAGFGLRYEITSCYALVFDTDLMYDHTSFNFSTANGSIRTENRIISLINASVGVRFNL